MKPFYAWAQTPPMGWNSWVCYGPTVTEEEVRANADYMAEHLKEYGWEYVVIDIRWFVENTKALGYNQKDPRYAMDEYGRLLPAVNRFPSAKDGEGFLPLAEYVHSKGLKFGIHIMRGIPVAAVRKKSPILGSKATAADIYTEERQCRWLRDMYTIVPTRPGAQAYYNSIFKLYAEWGVDYVKVDDLSSPYHAADVEMIRKAIDRCGRAIVLSMSPGRTPLRCAGHAKKHANLWRISGDLWDYWGSVRRTFRLCHAWQPHAGAGHWPDADLLPLGRIGIRAEKGNDRRTRLTKDEQITLMTLWCIFRSPLMFSGDLPSNDEFTLSLLTNPEVLEVNQRSTGNRPLFSRNRRIVWVAGIPDSRGKYLALFNLADPAGEGEKGVEMSVACKELGLEGACKVRDLWRRKECGVFRETITARVPAHGAVLYRVVPE
jgi:hypothetical protein